MKTGMRIATALFILGIATLGMMAFPNKSDQGGARGLTFYGTSVFDIICEENIHCDMSNNTLRISTEYYGVGVEPACYRKVKMKTKGVKDGKMQDMDVDTLEVDSCKNIQQKVWSEHAKEKK